jgi:hypothetical protein
MIIKINEINKTSIENTFFVEYEINSQVERDAFILYMGASTVSIINEPKRKMLGDRIRILELKVSEELITLKWRNLSLSITSFCSE